MNSTIPKPTHSTHTWYRCTCDKVDQIVKPPWWLFWQEPKIIYKRNPACHFHGAERESTK